MFDVGKLLVQDWRDRKWGAGDLRVSRWKCPDKRKTTTVYYPRRTTGEKKKTKLKWSNLIHSIHFKWKCDSTVISVFSGSSLSCCKANREQKSLSCLFEWLQEQLRLFVQGKDRKQKHVRLKAPSMYMFIKNIILHAVIISNMEDYCTFALFAYDIVFLF